MVDLAFRDAFIRAAQAEAENEKYTPQLRGYISALYNNVANIGDLTPQAIHQERQAIEPCNVSAEERTVLDRAEGIVAACIPVPASA